MSAYAFFAYTVMMCHFTFVLFVLGLIPLILAGSFLGWEWVYDPQLRGWHIALQCIVGIEALLSWPCPFTWAEDRFRVLAGMPTYGAAGFVDYWFSRWFSISVSPAAFNGICISVFFLSLLCLVVAPPKFLLAFQ